MTEQAFTVEDYERDVKGWEALFEEDARLPQEFKLSPEALARSKRLYAVVLKKLEQARRNNA